MTKRISLSELDDVGNKHLSSAEYSILELLPAQWLREAPSNGIPELRQALPVGALIPGLSPTLGFCSGPWSSQTVQLEISSSSALMQHSALITKAAQAAGRGSMGLNTVGLHPYSL